MNCLALEQRGEVMLVDCGVTFDNRGLGVDVVHPDFSALEAYRDRIAGVFITHGHEDHIGALPYLLSRFDVPVWAPGYAKGLIEERLGEHEVLEHARIVETTPRGLYKVGSFLVEPIRVTHSIADATALAITTDAGTVLHTGDFKFDATPPDGEAFDVDRVDELGEKGIALLFSDSTNIDAAGETGSERGVGDAMHQAIAHAEGAVVVGTFASNVHRLRMLGEIARHARRRLVLLGRSVETHARVARRVGYLDWPSDLVFPSERVGELPRSSILAVASGTQAEARGALSRLARGEHPSLKLEPGDTVLLSARTIPGNAPQVFSMIGDLLRRGVHLRTWITDRPIHVSGHAHRVEQKRMLELARPRCFVPVHGTLHHLTRHAELGRESGVPSVCVLENGDVGVLDESGLGKRGSVPVGRVHVYAGRPIRAAQLKERAALAAEGVVAVTIVVRKAGVEARIVTRGVLDETENAALLADAARQAREAFTDAASGDARGRRDDDGADAARLAVRRVLGKALRIKPMTVVTVVEAEGS